MNDSWLIKPEIHSRFAGLRPEIADLISLVDTDDPALTFIAMALAEMRDAGVEINAEAVKQAVKLGRYRWKNAPPIEPPTPIPSAQYVKRKGIVYYVKRGPLIKIGTTVDPHQRFAVLLPDAILAFEPGGRTLEAARHRQFQRFRAGLGEHFEASDELLDHVEAVRAEHGEADPRWPTSANISVKHRGAGDIPPASSSEVVTIKDGAQRTGMKCNTVRVWAHRGRLRAVGANARGHRLYFLDDIVFLADYYAAVGESRTIRV